MAATNPIKPTPPNSADVEATKLMANRAAGHPVPAKTTSNGSVANRIAGSKVGGGASIKGGSA